MTTTLSQLTHAAKTMEWAYRRTSPRPGRGGRAAQQRARDIARLRSWWSPNIAGFGIGPKERRKGDLKKLVVRFYVYYKLHKSRFPQSQMIPKKIPFDHLELEAGTDVRALDGVPQLNFLLTAGEQVGHFSGEQGTAGVFVRRENDDGPFLLSCAHVLAPPGTAPNGAIESPVDNDSLRAINQVGTVEDSFPLRSGIINECDGAIARMNVDVSNAIPGLDTPTSLLDSPEDLVGTSVSQLGAVTGRVVHGTVREMSATMSFAFRGAMFRFSNLVRYDIESRRGDSGAAVIENGTGRVLGLHMGAEGASTSAFFSPAHLMAKRFQITLL